MSPSFNQLKKLVLRPGAVFYGQIASLTSIEPHYIFLLNAKPSTDELYALTVASSRVERVAKLKEHFGEDTIAEIPLGTELFLTKPTYINCNDVKLLPVKYISGKYDNKELVCIESCLSEVTLKNIIECVKASKQVSDEIKSLLP